MKKLSQLKDRLSKYSLCENDQNHIKGGGGGQGSGLVPTLGFASNGDKITRPKGGSGMPPVLEGNSIAANFSFGG